MGSATAATCITKVVLDTLHGYETDSIIQYFRQQRLAGEQAFGETRANLEAQLEDANLTAEQHNQARIAAVNRAEVAKGQAERLKIRKNDFKSQLGSAIEANKSQGFRIEALEAKNGRLSTSLTESRTDAAELRRQNQFFTTSVQATRGRLNGVNFSSISLARDDVGSIAHYLRTRHP